MGREQDTLVSGSVINLPPIADLTDPRLPRTFKGWTQFRLNHAQQIEEIGLMQPAEVASLARELSSTIGERLSKNSNSLPIAKVGGAPLFAPLLIRSAFGLALVFFAKTEDKCARFFIL